MKKGGVVREIKGCRRRCLHHPAPTSAGKRGAKETRARARERERKKEREIEKERIAETRDTHDTPRRDRTTQRIVPRHTPHLTETRARDGMHATR